MFPSSEYLSSFRMKTIPFLYPFSLDDDVDVDVDDDAGDGGGDDTEDADAAAGDGGGDDTDVVGDSEYASDSITPSVSMTRERN
jgi:hypothetical protein